MLANIKNKLKYLYFPLTNFRPYIVYTVCMYKYIQEDAKKKNNPFKHPPPPTKSNRTHNGKSTFSAKKSSVY